MARSEKLENIVVSRSVLKCDECNRICHHDRKYSILSDVDDSRSLLFKRNENNKCFMCYHSEQHHSRLINPKIIKQLFIDSKENANTKDICQRIKYLGGKKHHKQIVNVLSDQSEAPYIWMNILWKSAMYTSTQQKMYFLKMLENEFEPDYTMQNNKGLTVIHILCLDDNIIDAETSQLLLLYFREESKYIKKDMFRSVCLSKRTPLHYAVESGKIESIKILIALYDNKTLLLKDNKKQTVMDIARQQKHTNIIEYLQQYKLDGYDEKKEDLYHEKQEWEMCLLHAINSLLQKKEYTSQQLNEICKQMAPDKIINPHKSIFQTGNYDANVLMMALNKINIDVQWFDARKVNELDLRNQAFLQPDNKCKFIGFILNNPQKTMFFINRRHWLTIKKIDNHWYNLDSKLNKPKKMDIVEATQFLKNALKKNKGELMICRTYEV